MAVDKLVDSTQLDACCTAEANAIRAKTGGSSQIAFDWANSKGFADAIAAIPTGGGGGINLNAFEATVTTVTVGANSVSNTYDAVQLLLGLANATGERAFIFIHEDKSSYVNNEFGALFAGFNTAAAAASNIGMTAYTRRYRNGAFANTNYGTNYDAKLVEGTKYDVLVYSLGGDVYS